MTVLALIALILFVASLAGCAYQAAAAVQVRRFMRAPEPEPAVRPGISLLKPLNGDEPRLADNLRTICRSDYPLVQILCNTLDPADSARLVAEQVRAEFPEVDMVVTTGAGSTARNRKVASLENILPQAKHPILAFADADVEAAPQYLDNLAAALSQPGVGLVTCLYVARPTGSFWGRLESLWINHTFLPSVLVARALGRRDGCFGATIALRRETLDRAGGLAPLRDLLADDWALGAAVRQLGLTIALAARPVDMVVHHDDFAGLFNHELRWARTIAALDRSGYTASILTQPVALGLAATLAGGFAWNMCAVLVFAVAVRLMVVRVEERALHLRAAPMGLLVLREFLTFAVFVAALLGRTVRWRGLRFKVRRDGTLQPLKEPAR